MSRALSSSLLLPYPLHTKIRIFHAKRGNLDKDLFNGRPYLYFCERLVGSFTQKPESCVRIAVRLTTKHSTDDPCVIAGRWISTKCFSQSHVHQQLCSPSLGVELVRDSQIFVLCSDGESGAEGTNMSSPIPSDVSFESSCAGSTS